MEGGTSEWEMVHAMDMHALEELKQRGNMHMQQREFKAAISIYTSILKSLDASSPSTPEETSRVTTLERLVHLNRAMAYLESQDASSLMKAERDCNFVLAKDTNCVKALYRRALTKERLHKQREALLDALEIQRMEPSNPAALELVARLKSYEAQEDHPPAKTETNVDDVWKSLQLEEQQVKKVFQSRRPDTVHSTQDQARWTHIKYDGIPEEIQRKTEDDWQSLLQEEDRTMHKVFSRSTSKSNDSVKV